MLTKSEVKYIQSLSQKKFRHEEGIYIIEGPKIVSEALHTKCVVIQKIVALKEWLVSNSANTKGIDTEIVAVHELQKLSQLQTANQVLALVQMPMNHPFDFDKAAISLALDGIQDPGNMGTIIRIADWFGVKQIICSTDCADVYNPKVVQSTMGSIFRTSIHCTELHQWMQTHADVVFYGAALNGTPLKTHPPISKGVIIMGNESKGIRPHIMNMLTSKITIEKSGDAESLNAAVATGILLSHLKS